MDALQILSNSWPIVISFIALIIWSVRLEGKVSFAEKEISELKIKHDNLDSALVNKIGEIEKSLARIEGWLKGKYGKEDQ